jgi:predicted TIM-barrel fold metal-dependent hydrolase
MRKYQVFSADGHLEVPSEAWTKYVPAKFKDKAPRTVPYPDGSEWLHMDDWVLENRLTLVSNMDYDEFLPHTGRTYHNPDGTLRPGTGDGFQRLREQDLDGIDAEILFPPQRTRFLIQNLIAKDKNAYLAVTQAFNTWLAEEFCAVAPDRLIGEAMVAASSVEDGIAEMVRCRKMGLRSVCLQKWPNGGDLYKPEDDRFFAAALDCGMTLSCHSSWGGKWPGDAGRNPVLKHLAKPGQPATPEAILSARVGTSTTGSHASFDSLGQCIYFGVFDRMPNLKFYMAESQAGWLPFALEASDEHYQRNYPYWDFKLKKLPSEYIRDNAVFSFIADRLATKFRYYIGVDLLMWGSDFPHSVGTSPHSRAFLAEMFDGVPENERRAILVENPCTFLGLDPNKAITETPA